MGQIGNAIGKDRSYISSMLKGKEPGAFTAQRLAVELGVDLNELLQGPSSLTVTPRESYEGQVHHQAAKVISDVLSLAKDGIERRVLSSNSNDMVVLLARWWHATGGRIGGHEKFADNVDLIRVPEATDNIVVPSKVGGNSLAAQDLRTSDPSALEALVKTFDATSRALLVKSYLEVSDENRPTFSPLMTALIPLPDGKCFEREFFSFKLPVTTQDNTPFVMSYCFKA